MAARRMIPYSDDISAQTAARVLEVLCEQGLLEASLLAADPEKAANQVMQLIAGQGGTNEAGDFQLGQFVLLPGADVTRFSLLLVTPWPAEERDHDLQLRASPITFERTAEDRIAIPARQLLAHFEAIASNPAASKPLRQLTMTLSRRGVMSPVVLPAEVETVALFVEASSTRPREVIEALPPGIVLSVREDDEA